MIGAPDADILDGTSKCLHCGSAISLLEVKSTIPRRYCSMACVEGARVERKVRRAAAVRRYSQSTKGRAKRRAWEIKNADVQRENRHHQYISNRDAAIARAARWAQANPEKRKEILRAYAATPKGKIAGYQARRRRLARIAKADGDFTRAEFLSLAARNHFHCLRCGSPHYLGRLEADHVIALSRGGSNDISNIQPLCRKCNAGKGVEQSDYRGFVCEGIAP